MRENEAAHGRVRQLGASLESEARDAAWAPFTEEEILVAAQDLGSSQLRRMECRATICTAELLSSSPDAQVQAVETFGRYVRSAPSKYFYLAPDPLPGGEFASTVFRMRAGHSFPPEE